MYELIFPKPSLNNQMRSYFKFPLIFFFNFYLLLETSGKNLFLYKIMYTVFYLYSFYIMFLFDKHYEYGSILFIIIDILYKFI